MKKSITALLAVVFLLCSCKNTSKLETSVETATTVTQASTQTSQTTEPEEPLKLSVKGMFNTINVDLSSFSEKTISENERIVLHPDFKEETPKLMGIVNDYLIVQNSWDNENILYRFNAETLEFIDKKELEKPAKFPHEYENDDAIKTFNKVSFCENAIVVAQPTKVTIYDENINIKASYDIDDSSKYVKKYGYYNATAIDQTHILYTAGQFTDNYIMDLKTGNELLINNKLDAENSMYIFGDISLSSDNFFMKSIAFKTDSDFNQTVDEKSYVHSNYNNNGNLIDFCYEQTLKENSAVISIDDQTIYKFKDDNVIKNAISMLLRSSRTAKTDSRLAIKNHVILAPQYWKLIDFKNQIIYNLKSQKNTDNPQKIINSCSYGGKTYLLIACYDTTIPNFLIII